MTLDDNDKEWAKLMMQAVARETLEAANEACRQRVDRHVAMCPHVQKLKWLLIGAGVVAGASAEAVFNKIVSIIG
jgi:hypothetical protein